MTEGKSTIFVGGDNSQIPQTKNDSNNISIMDIAESIEITKNKFITSVQDLENAMLEQKEYESLENLKNNLNKCFRKFKKEKPDKSDDLEIDKSDDLEIDKSDDLEIDKSNDLEIVY